MEQIQNLLNQVAIISKKNAEMLDAVGGRFNMFRVCGVDHYENTHSAIIAELLRPDGSHGLKSKLLECFIENLPCNDAIKRGFDCATARVVTERSVGDGRIDIVIEDGKNHAIIIENKIYAGDQSEQLKRYNSFAEKEYGKDKYQIFYLTLWGVEASEQSAKKVAYTCISYETDIIAWLEKCLSVAVRLPIVRETIIQYINHLKSLTNQDMDTKNKEDLIQLLSKSESLEAVFAIGDSLSGVKNHLVNKVFLPSLNLVCEKLGLQNYSVECDWVNTPWTSFPIHNPAWKIFKIGFHFDTKGLGNLIVAVTYLNNEIRNEETFEKLKTLFPRKNDNGVFKSFQKHGYWGKDAMIAIQNGEMARLFKDEIEKILEATKGWEM